MIRNIFVLCSVAVLLTACGGGSGGGAPTLNVSLSSSSGNATVTEGGQATLTTTGTASGSVSTPVVADVQYDTSVFASGSAVAGSTSGTYTVSAQTRSDLAPGEYKGNVTFRLCQETACTHVYAGSTVTYAYDIVVNLKDWATYQREPGHSGYVHLTLDPSKFAKAWEWSAPNGELLSTISSHDGTIFVSGRSSFGTIHAISASSGTQLWSYDAPGNSLGAPGYAAGNVYVQIQTMNETNSVTALNASTGTYVQQMSFASQWAGFLAPTLYSDSAYIAAGYYGNGVYAFKLADGSQTWTASDSGGSIWDGEAPAVDETYVYYYSGSALDVFNRSTGAKVASISDPFFNWSGYSYYSGPIIGSDQNVIAFSGSAMNSGSMIDQAQVGRPLVNFSVKTGSYAWRTANVYRTAPAFHNGMLFAGRKSSATLDAIKESDGSILWSWSAPGDSTTVGNVVVVDNLVFVSTEAHIYAIDLTTHATVWTYNAPGALAIIPGSILVISEGSYAGNFSTIFSDGKLVAIKLM